MAGRKGRPPAPPASRRSSRRRRRGSRGLCRPWSSTANYEGRTGVTSRTNNRRKVRGDKGLHLLTDVSYVRYGPGGSRLCYLSAVKDASTNEILAWELSESYGSGFVLRTVAALASLDWLPDQALLHSDQGCHYASKAYRSSLRAMGMAQSMSRRGNRWDNAPMESWFGHAKDEIPLEGRGSFREVRALVADYVDYYNNERPQAGLGGMTPRERRDYLLSLPSMLPAVVPGTKENPSGVPA